MSENSAHPHADLQRIARRAMIERGLVAEFSKDALAQVAAIPAAAASTDGDVRDLRKLLWCSIDNDDSRDLDQLSVMEEQAGGAVKIFVAVADVDALVKKGTPLDAHAARNTTSIYTAAEIFPMLPEKLSTDLTSLNSGVDRVAMILEYVVNKDGTLGATAIYRANVHNYAKLAYNALAAWLDAKGPMPEAIAKVPGMEKQVRVQEEVASRLRKLRHETGALDFQSLESRPVFEGEKVVGLEAHLANRATQLIEEFMVAANGVSARFLESKKFPSLRRVVKSPERWAKIVGVAAGYSETLPAEPSSQALEAFLRKRKLADPLRFPDLSLVIVKLMGHGEYVAEAPGASPTGHFGLAVRDYSHTTAPNRRFPDLITHRLLKSALAGKPPAYSLAELGTLGAHCTEMEGAATKVERQVRKSAAALLLQHRIGEVFDGVITGAADKGTFVRVFNPPVEGRVVRGEQGLHVGDKVRVSLTGTDFERGFLDFARAH